MTKKPKVAVVCYGFLRTWEITANSFIKHVLAVNKADLFIFAPKKTGCQSFYHKSDNNDASFGDNVTTEQLQQVYGDYLKGCELYDYNEKNFLTGINLSNVSVIADINPIRQVSLFFHINKSLSLLEQYEKKHKFKYDIIILTRPDLAFYSAADISKLDMSIINLPIGEGFEKNYGKRRTGLATVFYYKNVEDGICIPGGTHNFNDQLIVSKRDNIIHLKDIYTNFQSIMDKQIPCNAETITFYWLKGVNNIAINSCWDVLYEIFRPHYKKIENVNDLSEYKEDKTLTAEQEKILRHLNFYKKFYKIYYMFNKHKRREKKQVISILTYRKHRIF